MAKSVFAGEGQRCPKGHGSMIRRRHRPTWTPKPNQPYWFEFWDMCRKCKHIQHYESAKRFRGEANAPVVTGNVTHVYCGSVPPWDDSLGPFRDFTAEEKAVGVVCRPA